MSTYTKIKNFWQRYGLYESIIFELFKFLQRTIHLDRQEVVLLDPSSLRDKKIALSANYTGGFIDYETLRIQSANDPELEMDEEFLNEAIEKHDLCYAIRNDEGIISYGWYSQKPTRIKDELFFYFDEQYVYMYKGLTKPEFRGERLHAIGMASAMQSPQLRHTKGMVSWVERPNPASLKSVYRIGYRREGSIYTIKLFGNYYSYSTPGCKLTSASAMKRVLPEVILNVKVP